jgi:two-component system, LuxR family, sensor kinase FixL
MHWVEIIWSMSAATCLALAGVHLLVWLKARDSWLSLLFSTSAVAAAVIAGFEMAMMHTHTTAQFGVLLRWMQVPVWVIVVSLVWFVKLYLRADRPWLVWTVCGARTLALLLNFLSTTNLNFREITSLRPFPLWGETVSLPVGVTNPWTLVGQLSSLCFLIYVLDTSISACRRGDHRRALVMGGIMALATVLAAGQAALLVWGVLPLPYILSLAFLAIIVVMGHELSRDLLQAARLARELQISEAEFRSLFELSAAGVAQAVPATGRLTRVNKRFCQITGHSPEELLGMTYRDLTHPDDVASDATRIQAVLQGQADTWESEKRYLKKSGGIVWVLVNGTMIHDKDGRAFRTLATIQDITQLKRAEEVAAEHRRQLAHFNRVSTMGELAASMAHELKQPLTGILSNAQAGELLLERSPPDTVELREVLAGVISDTRRASEIISHMRDFLRKRDTPRQPLDINVIIEEVLRILRSEAVIRDIRLLSDLVPDLPRVMGDRIQLQQVVLNVITNAQQAMAGVDSSARQLIIRTCSGGESRVVLIVEDSGPGFEPGAMEKLFQPFFTTRAEGLGMGLAICLSIIEDHRGTIIAENRPEGGARIRIGLPAAEDLSFTVQSSGGKT